MSKKKNYYSNQRLKETGADIYILYGERSNGKSYSVKHNEGIIPYFNGGIEYISTYKDKEKVIQQAFKAGRRFIYLRRTQTESDLQASPLTSSLSKLLNRYTNDYQFSKLSKNV